MQKITVKYFSFWGLIASVVLTALAAGNITHGTEIGAMSVFVSVISWVLAKAGL
jgi:hypothetical protein